MDTLVLPQKDPAIFCATAASAFGKEAKSGEWRRDWGGVGGRIGIANGLGDVLGSLGCGATLEAFLFVDLEGGTA